MIRVTYTRRLRRELHEIVDTIARDNAPAAEAFVDRLDRLCSLLAVAPAMGRLRPEVGPNIRSIGLGNYLVFYRWHAEAQRVDILSVWHGRRRLPSISG
jgi:toxin ParE1/3/4